MDKYDFLTLARSYSLYKRENWVTNLSTPVSDMLHPSLLGHVYLYIVIFLFFQVSLLHIRDIFKESLLGVAINVICTN